MTLQKHRLCGKMCEKNQGLCRPVIASLNINNLRKLWDLILKSTNLDKTVNLGYMVLTQKYLISRILENLSGVEDILPLRRDK